MKRSIIGFVLAAGILCLNSGCGIIRGIEQWKCDNLGMCHFGIRPSIQADGCCNTNPAACPPQSMMPQSMMPQSMMPPVVLPPPSVQPNYIPSDFIQPESAPIAWP